jgi:hypothetical protein
MATPSVCHLRSAHHSRALPEPQVTIDLAVRPTRVNHVKPTARGSRFAVYTRSFRSARAAWQRLTLERQPCRHG